VGSLDAPVQSAGLPLVYRWCRHAGLQDNDAADVSQETFRAAADGIATFHRDRPSDSFRGWLWTITKNKLRDHFRRLAERPGAVGGSAANQRLLDVPDTIAKESEEAAGFDAKGSLVHRALELVRNEFEDRTWQAFLRVVVGGEHPSHVAADLDMTVGAVYTAKWRVLRRLREEIDGLL
jgi:RNA polymerase sigma-70 factor (ECF subfamily)